jgi:uncharacterized protein
MPVLAGTRIVGLVDPGREAEAFVAKQVTLLRPGAVPQVAHAVAEAASWVGSTSIVLDRVEPAAARAELESTLRT